MARRKRRDPSALTFDEQIAFALLACGMTIKEAGEFAGTSTSTASRQVARVCAKLGRSNRASILVELLNRQVIRMDRMGEVLAWPWPATVRYVQTRNALQGSRQLKIVELDRLIVGIPEYDRKGPGNWRLPELPASVRVRLQRAGVPVAEISDPFMLVVAVAAQQRQLVWDGMRVVRGHSAHN